MDSLRKVPVLRVLWRRHLLLGGERELVLMLLVIAVALVMNGQNIPSIIVAAMLWVVILPALRYMAKIDPQMSMVYLRHIRYRRFYPARSRPYRKL